jgi:hypothetical protein
MNKISERSAKWMLQRLSRRFARTHDPMDAWTAYYVARQAGLQIPGYVGRYLDEVAAKLVAVDRSGSGKPAAIAEALGLHARAGGPSIIKQRATARRDVSVVRLIQTAQAFSEPQMTMKAAITQVAKDVGLSAASVRRIWERHSR